MTSYRCSTCGELHHDLPDIGANEPYQALGYSKAERKKHVKLTADTCIIEKRDYFIRGVLEIPLTDSEGYFGYGVWVSLAEKNFRTYLANFDSDAIGPFFGWFCTKLDLYEPTTIGLKTDVRFRAGKQRPRIILEPTDHPLAVEQRDGISLDRAWQIVHHYS